MKNFYSILVLMQLLSLAKSLEFEDQTKESFKLFVDQNSKNHVCDELMLEKPLERMIQQYFNSLDRFSTQKQFKDYQLKLVTNMDLLQDLLDLMKNFQTTKIQVKNLVPFHQTPPMEKSDITAFDDEFYFRLKLNQLIMRMVVNINDYVTSTDKIFPDQREKLIKKTKIENPVWQSETYTINEQVYKSTEDPQPFKEYQGWLRELENKFQSEIENKNDFNKFLLENILSLGDELKDYQDQVNVFVCDYQWAIYQRFGHYILGEEKLEIEQEMKNDLDFVSNMADYNQQICPDLPTPMDFFLKFFIHLKEKETYDDLPGTNKLIKFLFTDLEHPNYILNPHGGIHDFKIIYELDDFLVNLKNPDYHHKYQPRELRDFYQKIFLKFKDPKTLHEKIMIMYRIFGQIIDKFEDVKDPLRTQLSDSPFKHDLFNNPEDPKLKGIFSAFQTNYLQFCAHRLRGLKDPKSDLIDEDLDVPKIIKKQKLNNPDEIDLLILDRNLDNFNDLVKEYDVKELDNKKIDDKLYDIKQGYSKELQPIIKQIIEQTADRDIKEFTELVHKEPEQIKNHQKLVARHLDNGRMGQLMENLYEAEQKSPDFNSAPRKNMKLIFKEILENPKYQTINPEHPNITGFKHFIGKLKEEHKKKAAVIYSFIDFIADHANSNEFLKTTNGDREVFNFADQKTTTSRLYNQELIMQSMLNYTLMLPYNLVYRQKIFKQEKEKMLQENEKLQPSEISVQFENICLDYDPLIFINKNFIEILTNILKTENYSQKSEIEELMKKNCITSRNEFFKSAINHIRNQDSEPTEDEIEIMNIILSNVESKLSDEENRQISNQRFEFFQEFIYQIVKVYLQPEAFYYQQILSGDFLVEFNRYKFMNDSIDVYKNFLEVHEETLRDDVFEVFQRIFDFMSFMSIEKEFMYDKSLYQKTLEAMEECYEGADHLHCRYEKHELDEMILFFSFIKLQNTAFNREQINGIQSTEFMQLIESERYGGIHGNYYKLIEYILYDLGTEYDNLEQFNFYQPELFEKNKTEKVHEILNQTQTVKEMMLEIKIEEQSLKRDILAHCDGMIQDIINNSFKKKELNKTVFCLTLHKIDVILQILHHPNFNTLIYDKIDYFLNLDSEVGLISHFTTWNVIDFMRTKGDDYGVDFSHFETEYDKHLIVRMIDMKEQNEKIQKGEFVEIDKFGLDFENMNETDREESFKLLAEWVAIKFEQNSKSDEAYHIIELIQEKVFGSKSDTAIKEFIHLYQRKLFFQGKIRLTKSVRQRFNRLKQLSEARNQTTSQVNVKPKIRISGPKLNIAKYSKNPKMKISEEQKLKFQEMLKKQKFDLKKYEEHKYRHLFVDNVAVTLLLYAAKDNEQRVRVLKNLDEYFFLIKTLDNDLPKKIFDAYKVHVSKNRSNVPVRDEEEGAEQFKLREREFHYRQLINFIEAVEDKEKETLNNTKKTQENPLLTIQMPEEIQIGKQKMTRFKYQRKIAPKEEVQQDTGFNPSNLQNFISTNDPKIQSTKISLETKQKYKDPENNFGFAFDDKVGKIFSEKTFGEEDDDVENKKKLLI